MVKLYMYYSGRCRITIRVMTELTSDGNLYTIIIGQHHMDTPYWYQLISYSHFILDLSALLATRVPFTSMVSWVSFMILVGLRKNTKPQSHILSAWHWCSWGVVSTTHAVRNQIGKQLVV